jgi:hypothetical protein
MTANCSDIVFANRTSLERAIEFSKKTRRPGSILKQGHAARLVENKKIPVVDDNVNYAEWSR